MVGERPASLGLIRTTLVLSIVGFSGCLNSGPFQFHGTTASSFMRTIEESKDPNARYVAYDKLASSRTYENDEQKTRAAQLLVKRWKTAHEPIATRVVICRTLGMLGKPDARAVILAATNDEDALVRCEACRALGRVGRPEDATVLARIMILDNSTECKVAAIESLGDLKSTDPRINELLITGMEHVQPVIRVACMNSLRSITGKDFGVDAVAWKKHFDASAPKMAAPPASTSPIPAEAAATIPPALNRELPPEIP